MILGTFIMALSAYSLLIFLGASIVMIYALFLAIQLKSNIPGGKIGKLWHLLFILILVFSGGYIAIPFLKGLSPEVLRLAVSIIFLFGAVYVVITILILQKIISILID